MSKVVCVNEVDYFEFSYVKYVTAKVNNVEDNMDNNNAQITFKWKNPMLSGYFPELDVNVELKDNGMQYHQ